MKLIASANHYQKMLQEQNHIEQEVKEEFARMTPSELEAQEKQHALELEKARMSFKERNRAAIPLPNPLKRWKFRRAAKKALTAAEYFDLDVYIEADENVGHIRMSGDQILSDTIWHDGKHKRRLLLPIKWADSVLIDSVEEYGTDAVHISLTYRMVATLCKPYS